jgi:hypothetical protein
VRRGDRDERGRQLRRRPAPGADGGVWERSDERHPLVLHDPGEVLADLRRAGFAEVEALDAWGDLGLRPGHVAFVARRAS